MNKKKVKVDTFAKMITFIVVLHGMLCITASYILSFLGRDPVVSVSTVLVTEITAPTLSYCLGNVIANIFEKNVTKFSSPVEYLKENLQTDDSSIGDPCPNKEEPNG